MPKEVVDVAILSANYNNGEYLSLFLQSILDSTVWPKQVIIVDDASIDNSIEVVKSFSSTGLNIQVIELGSNVGFANALNTGLDYVTSEYILRIDPDDFMLATRIEAQFTFLNKNPTIDIVGSNVSYFIGSDRQITGSSSFPIDHDTIMENYVAGGHGVCHGAVMLKSQCLKLEPYMQDNVPAEEYDIFSRLLIRGNRFANIPNVLTLVRVHGASVSHNMPLSTVTRTFHLRRKHWGITTNSLYIYKEFMVRNAYRRYISTKSVKRYFPLLLAVTLKPISAFKRLIRNEK